MEQQQKEDSVEQTTPNRPLRLALVVSERTVNEYSTFLNHLLIGLADESIAVALICPQDCNVDSVVYPAVEIIRHPVFELPLFWRQNRRMLLEKLEKFKPNVLHCLCESKALFTRGLSRQLELPYVLSINSLQNRWRRFFVSSRRCTKIIVSAESIANNVAQNYPHFAERIEKVNIGTFSADTPVCFGQRSGPASIVTSIRMKNGAVFENLFGAIKHLVIDGYEFIVVIISSGRVETQMRKVVSKLGLSQTVTVIPQLEPRRLVLAAGDIFVHPVVSRAFSPMLMEAMSVGSAVAACKGGVDDLLIEDETAVVFDPNDELSIYAKLQKLLDAPDSTRQMAKRAQQHLRENYSVNGMVGSILRIYHDARDWFKQ